MTFLECSANLLDTGAQRVADLGYTLDNGDAIGVTPVDYDTLRSLSEALDDIEIPDGPDLEARVVSTARAVIQNELAALGQSIEGWDVLLNHSKPEGQIWVRVETPWVHLTNDGQVAAAPAATLDASGDPVTTWRVVSIKA